MGQKTQVGWLRRRTATLSVACLLAGTVIAATVYGLGGSASGQSPPVETSALDDVDECDLLAADPTDPQRVSEGVADTAIIPRLAIKACETAERQQPAELRFAFQLARALIAGNRAEAANTHLERAANGQYAVAIATLADLRAEASDTVPSASFSERLNTAWAVLRDAVAMHDRALREGYRGSEQRKAALTFDGAIYTQPILGQIAQGDFEAALTSSREADARAYLYAFTTNALGQCGPLLSARAVAQLARYRFFSNSPPEEEDSTLISVQPLLGEIDAQRFVRRHGCEGPVTDLFFTVAMPAFFDAL